jgi:membrane associated rhomboid family serine protease
VPSTDPDWIVVFRGARALCDEFGLVLEARALPWQLIEADGAWALAVPSERSAAALEELSRYAAERAPPRPPPPVLPPFPGAPLGAALYVLVLLAAAYGAGAHAFRTDWFDAGAVESGPGVARQWWRAVTALTLHVDPSHLLDNALFGAGIGVLASRLLGPGVAWASILAAGTIANSLEMWIAPPEYRAVGASTAVFAALGLLAGYAWRGEFTRAGRWMYRWTPLFAGVSLLALLGTGDGHVDVLGHLLGFCAGVAEGWLYARAGLPRSRRGDLQWGLGAAALLAVAGAWALALRSG